MPGNFHEVPEYIRDHWPAPNYVDPVRRTWMPEFASILPAVSTVLIAGRFWLRATKQAGGFGLDDLFIGLGWGVSVGFSAVAIYSTVEYVNGWVRGSVAVNHLDRHTWDVHPRLYEDAALCGFIAQLLFLVSTCATKTSVLLFYRRMVSDTYSKAWLWTIWAALAFLGGYFVSVLFAYCFMCTPLTAYWESYNYDYDREFTCLEGNILSPLVGVLSVITDIYAVILPCAMLQRVNLDVPRRQKIGLNVIFSLSLVVAGFGIARTYYLWEVNNDYDTSWTGFDLFVWSLLECHFAIIFACAPSLRAFVRRYLGDSISRTFGSTNKSGGGRSADFRDGGAMMKQRRVEEGRGEEEGGGKDRHDNRFVKKSLSQVDEREREESQESIVPHTVFYHKESAARSSTVLSGANWPLPPNYGQSKSPPQPRSPPQQQQQTFPQHPPRPSHPPIRSAEDYEAYAMRELNRAVYNSRSHATTRTDMFGRVDSAGYDWGDPQRRWEAENAV